MTLDLQHWRAAIDQIDKQIVALLNQRGQCAQAIATIKAEQPNETAVYRPQREAEVLSRVEAHNQSGPLYNQDLVQIYREIMSACRALERRLQVAVLGPQGTFSEYAAYRLLGHAIDLQFCSTIDEVFRQCETEHCDFALIPVENSSEGVISRSLDSLLTSSLTIQAELSLLIRHCLLSQSGELGSIQQIAAHPQSAAQCRGWLAQNMPQIEVLSVNSNAQAAQLAARNPQMAAIAAAQTATLYQLQVVAHDIQDDAHNRTRFALIGRPHNERRPHFVGEQTIGYQTALILSTANVAGALYQLLQPFEQYGVSMTRFESRPARSGSWAYYFYVDIEGHHSEPAVAQVLVALQQRASYFKNLGSYPVYA